jgi:phytoene dehydrogenase-like protein
MEKSIIIIGGGLTGLSAGCYGQMNDYRTSIFEMHAKSGGVCTGWQRKDYTIDGAMHWLVGTRQGKAFYNIWEELGAAQDWKIIDHDQFLRTELESGRVFTIYSDIDRLKEHMMELGPEDKDTTDELIKAIRTCSNLEMPVDKAPELYSMIDGMKMVKMLPYLGFMRKWSKTSTADFAHHFKNPVLRDAFGDALGGDIYNIPMFFMLMTFAWLHQKMAGYPVGGALALSSAIERRYLSLGGEIHFKSRVDKILVENDRAVGVRLADGTEHRGDIVISAADGRTTIFDMLDGRYIDDKIRGYYNNAQLFPPLIYIGLGVARKFDDVPPSVVGMSFSLDEPIIVAGKENKRLGVQVYNFDPTLAPEGKTLLKVQFNTDYDYWEQLGKEPARYKAEKEQIADQVVARLNQRFPGLAAQVEMRDVATPLTWVRYTGNWRGSYEGWFPKNWNFRTRMSKTLPGLDNFYMAGQWVEPGGGMPTAAMSGRNVTQIICKRDKRPFITTKLEQF